MRFHPVFLLSLVSSTHRVSHIQLSTDLETRLELERHLVKAYTDPELNAIPLKLAPDMSNLKEVVAQATPEQKQALEMFIKELIKLSDKEAAQKHNAHAKEEAHKEVANLRKYYREAYGLPWYALWWIWLLMSLGIALIITVVVFLLVKRPRPHLEAGSQPSTAAVAWSDL
jgi:hypothetical protein